MGWFRCLGFRVNPTIIQKTFSQPTRQLALGRAGDSTTFQLNLNTFCETSEVI
jgi:hypothetical protein